MAQPSAFKPSLPQVSWLFLERGRGTGSPSSVPLSSSRGGQGCQVQGCKGASRPDVEPRPPGESAWLVQTPFQSSWTLGAPGASAGITFPFDSHPAQPSPAFLESGPREDLGPFFP